MSEDSAEPRPAEHGEDPEFDPYGPPPPGTEEEVDPGWPWSFLLLVFAGALYLVFRLSDFVRDLVN